MTAFDILSAALAVAGLVHLVYALLASERLG